MPRPAKPPMTLKEAKRAYKKEAVGFQYTASQMARADRQDAHEEKRKKALEKERQRVENKRKREEKLERERAVKQKMLDEGRITLEDTWGKVTASQPRLNRFFGQKAAVVPAKRKLQEQTVTEAETSSQDERATDNDKRIRETQSAPPSAVKPPTTHILTTISTYSQGVESTLRNQVITRNASQRAFSSAGPDAQKCEDDQGEEVQSQRSRLKYLNPSQINARSKIVQDQQGDKSQSPVRRPLPVVHIASEGLSEPARHSQTGKHDGDISTPASTSHSRSSSSQDNTPTSTTDAIDNEEDFTDGIDDQTLMMLYDEQEQDTSTPTTANASQPPVKDLNVEESAPTSPAKTDECPSPKPRAATSNAIANQHKGTIPPISKGLSESFSSVFNEIDDDDLIALAEKVEANMPSPTSAVTAPISISSTTPAMPDRKVQAPQQESNH